VCVRACVCVGPPVRKRTKRLLEMAKGENHAPGRAENVELQNISNAI